MLHAKYIFTNTKKISPRQNANISVSKSGAQSSIYRLDLPRPSQDAGLSSPGGIGNPERNLEKCHWHPGWGVDPKYRYLLPTRLVCKGFIVWPCLHFVGIHLRNNIYVNLCVNAHLCKCINASSSFDSFGLTPNPIKKQWGGSILLLQCLSRLRFRAPEIRVYHSHHHISIYSLGNSDIPLQSPALLRHDDVPASLPGGVPKFDWGFIATDPRRG